MSNFGDAFKAARKAGKKEFSWNGKRYTTKLAADTPKKAPTPTPRPSDSNQMNKAQEKRDAAPKAAPTAAEQRRSAAAANNTDAKAAVKSMLGKMDEKRKRFSLIKSMKIDTAKYVSK